MKDNPPDVLNAIFIRESYVRYAHFPSHLTFIVRSRFMILNVCGVCVMLFGHKHNTFSASILTGVTSFPRHQVAPNICGRSVWNFPLFNFQAPRI